MCGGEINHTVQFVPTIIATVARKFPIPGMSNIPIAYVAFIGYYNYCMSMHAKLILNNLSVSHCIAVGMYMISYTFVLIESLSIEIPIFRVRFK